MNRSVSAFFLRMERRRFGSSDLETPLVSVVGPALAFVLSLPAVIGAIVGVRNEHEAAELAPAAQLRFTPDEVAAIASRAAE